MQAVVNDDFSAITGNPIKFGLGFVSVSFDLVFMVQHYLLYSGSRYLLDTPGLKSTLYFFLVGAMG